MSTAIGEARRESQRSVKIRGVWCAILSPLTTGGDLDARLLVSHVRRLFAAGVDGVALFGTTGEGQSFSVAERKRGLESLLAGGVAAGRVLVGTGCAALPDTVDLTRHAAEAGCAGSLVLPPFFFKDVDAEGVYATYARLIDATDAHLSPLYLYHIPQVSGVRIAADAVARLVAAYPGVVAGIKDSEGNLDHTLDLLRRFPELAIFVGHEPHLPPALAAGGAGTICGLANFYPRLMRRLFDAPSDPRQSDDIARLRALIALLGRYPVFAAFKALQADMSEEAGWEHLRVPLVPLPPSLHKAWLDDVASLGFDTARDGASPR